MREKMRARNAMILLRPALLGAAALLGACIFGGTGTDTDNGLTQTTPVDRSISARVVDSAGRPVEDVTLVLHTPGFRPDSGGAEQLLDSARTLVTDSAGYARFRMARAGAYVIEGSRGGAVLFYDTLAVADSLGRADYTFRSRPSRSFQGAVRLLSGLRVDSGVIFVRGTGLTARLTAEGAYDLGDLPAEVSLMSVGLRYRASPREFRVAELKNDTTKPVSLNDSFSCRVIPRDSAEKQPSYQAVTGGPATASPDKATTGPATFDSTRIKAAAGSCDSLQSGTVVTVKAPDPKSGPLVRDSVVSAPYVVVDGQGSTQPVLVPLKGCVAAPGSESTTFSVSLQPSTTGADALVGDVSGSCVAPK